MAHDTVSKTQLRKPNNKTTLASRLEKASYFAINWNSHGTISANDYFQLGAPGVDCKVVAVTYGAESGTGTLNIYKDDVPDAADGTTVCSAKVMVAGDEGTSVSLTVNSDDSENIVVSTHPVLKAKWTKGSTNMLNGYITVLLKTIEKIT